MTPRQLERAMFAPASVFASPEHVLVDAQLSKEQKIEILLRWAYDAAEEAVAVEEGMPGRDSDLARRIFVALGKLNAAIDIEHTGPSKHHGIALPPERCGAEHGSIVNFLGSAARIRIANIGGVHQLSRDER